MDVAEKVKLVVDQLPEPPARNTLENMPDHIVSDVVLMIRHGWRRKLGERERRKLEMER